MLSPGGTLTGKRIRKHKDTAAGRHPSSALITG
jgi:hypothetical protein